MSEPCPVCKDPAAHRRLMENHFGIEIRCNTCTPFFMPSLEVKRRDKEAKPDMELSARIKAEGERRGPSARFPLVEDGQIKDLK